MKPERRFIAPKKKPAMKKHANVASTRRAAGQGCFTPPFVTWTREKYPAWETAKSVSANEGGTVPESASTAAAAAQVMADIENSSMQSDYYERVSI